MHDLNDLYLYVQVVDHGGFASAGRALGITKSKLSRRTGLLEDRLGVRLIQRSTRRFSITDVGQTYYSHCKSMLVEAAAAQEAIDMSRSEPCGIIRMTCPSALLDARVGTMLADFMARNRRVEVHLESTNRTVDVISDAVDVSIRLGGAALRSSGLVVRSLANCGRHLCASPRFLAMHGTPSTPGELHGLPSLGLGLPQDDHAWQLVGPGDAIEIVRHRPSFITRSILSLRAAAIAGVGVVELPIMMARRDIERGALVRVLPEWAAPRETIHAVFASRRGQLPSVRALIDFFAEQFARIEED